MIAERRMVLKISSAAGEKLAELVWQGGVTYKVFAKPTIARTVDGWIAHGLDEWIGEGVDARPVSTPSSSPEFLDRLEEHLAKQFSFRLRMREEVSPPAFLVGDAIYAMTLLERRGLGAVGSAVASHLLTMKASAAIGTGLRAAQPVHQISFKLTEAHVRPAVRSVN